jgi:hypothetical protein
MAIGWLGLALIQAGTSLVMSRVQRRPPRPRPPGFEGPSCEEGKPIPIVYGQAVLQPNVVWYGNVVGPPDPPDGRPPEYSAAMVMTLCHGPVDEISDIQFGGKSIRMAPTHSAGTGGNVGTAIVTPALPYLRPGSADTPASFVVEGSRFFGGGAGEGGVGWSGSGSSDEGALRFYWGGLNQAADQLTIQAYDKLPGITGSGQASGKPSLAYIPMGTTQSRLFLTTRRATP